MFWRSYQERLVKFLPHRSWAKADFRSGWTWQTIVFQSSWLWIVNEVILKRTGIYRRAECHIGKLLNIPKIEQRYHNTVSAQRYSSWDNNMRLHWEYFNESMLCASAQIKSVYRMSRDLSLQSFAGTYRSLKRRRATSGSCDNSSSIFCMCLCMTESPGCIRHEYLRGTKAKHWGFEKDKKHDYKGPQWFEAAICGRLFHVCVLM